MNVDMDRVAQLTAHRACHGAEHDPLNGRIHGYCIVCGVPWPCEYAGSPPAAFPLYEFTTLLMCSDPWPVADKGHGTGWAVLNDLADREARRAGFDDWIDAYHKLKAPSGATP